MLKTIVIVLFILKNVFDIVLNYINDTYSGGELPWNVRDVYDGEEYARWRSYEKETSKLYVIRKTVSVVYSSLILAFNAHAFLYSQVSDLNPYLQNLVVIFFLGIVDEILLTPFAYYRTFVIEEKYGMNKTTKKTFLLDAIKNIGVNTVLIFLLISLIMFLYERFGNRIIVLGSIVMLVVSVVISYFIIPLMRIYNRFTPLEEGSLKERLIALSEKHGTKIKKIIVKDASKRTTKANAFCTGLGKWKTISLDDNLIKNFEEDEILAVFAHEFGHAKYRHVLKSLPFGVFSTAIGFVAIALALNARAAYTEFGFDGINYFLALTLTSAFLWPLEMVLNAISNYISRGHERQADAFAASEGYGQSLISALKRLNKEALSEINPHPLVVALEYSHPTLSQRIEAIECLGTHGQSKNTL